MSYISRLSSKNRAALGRSTVAGCYSCLGTFKPEEVKRWADRDRTAVCPFCDAETVLPGVDSLGELRAAHAYAFEEPETTSAAPLSVRPGWL